MPIYEYECDKCGHAFEREQKMSDAPVKTCPKCKGRRVTKLISLSSFALKGGGWYADGYTDSKKSKEDKPTKSGGDSDSKDSGASKDSSSDTSKKTSSNKEGKSSKGGKSSKSAA